MSAVHGSNHQSSSVFPPLLDRLLVQSLRRKANLRQPCGEVGWDLAISLQKPFSPIKKHSGKTERSQSGLPRRNSWLIFKMRKTDHHGLSIPSERLVSRSQKKRILFRRPIHLMG